MSDAGRWELVLGLLYMQVSAFLLAGILGYILDKQFVLRQCLSIRKFKLERLRIPNSRLLSFQRSSVHFLVDTEGPS
jgi:hypothetical protein